MDRSLPHQAQNTHTMAKKLLEEILLRYGMPALLSSDNGPAFSSQVIKGLSKVPWADWKLHCAYRPQSSGQVEWMNRTLKETLTKLTLETGGDWVSLLPYVLFRVRNTPYMLNLRLFEIMSGRASPLIPSLQSRLLAEINDSAFLTSLKALPLSQEGV